MRRRFGKLVAREIGHARRGGQGHIIIKCNALTDHRMIRLLYRASQAGVLIDLIIRGVCALRPGLPGISERIHVRSIVGRFLEHSRIWYFENDGAPEVYIGSADLMERNLNKRVEAAAPDRATRNWRCSCGMSFSRRTCATTSGRGYFVPTAPTSQSPATARHSTRSSH